MSGYAIVSLFFIIMGMSLNDVTIARRWCIFEDCSNIFQVETINCELTAFI